MSNKLFRIPLLLTAAAMILTACAAPTPVATQVSPATQVASSQPRPRRAGRPSHRHPRRRGNPDPATSTQPPKATAVPATPTSVPTVTIDPDRPNDLTEARLRVSECVWIAMVRLPDMDIYINGKMPVVAGVPLTHFANLENVSRYEYLAPGTVSVAVVPTGMGIDTPTPLLAPLDVTLEAGHRYTVVVMGEADETMRQGVW